MTMSSDLAREVSGAAARAAAPARVFSAFLRVKLTLDLLKDE
jgi:hypothetical protein